MDCKNFKLCINMEDVEYIDSMIKRWSQFLAELCFQHKYLTGKILNIELKGKFIDVDDNRTWRSLGVMYFRYSIYLQTRSSLTSFICFVKLQECFNTL